MDSIGEMLARSMQDMEALVSQPPPQSLTYSDTQYEIIRKYILAFQKSLDNEHDVGIMLTSFGKAVLMEVTDIDYEEPVLMVFRGFVDGKKATLIQHVSQLNFLLTAIEKPLDQPHRTLGFNSGW